MISAELINLLRRRVPNYHVLSPAFVKGCFSICPCAACQSVLKGKSYGGVRQYNCSRVMDDCQRLGCIGNSLVAAYGTCDAAHFVPEKWDDFKLEVEKIDLQPKAEPEPDDGTAEEPAKVEGGEAL